MNEKLLRKFIVDANAAGYAGGDEKKWTREKDKSTTIQFKKGEWRMNDNFFGGEPYGGRIIISHKNKPVWMMVYYGSVKKNQSTDSIYKILRNSLARMPEKYPFRGPKNFKEADFVYKNRWKGNIKEYSGEEKIYKKNKLIYKAIYLGGFVDERRGV